MEETRVIRRKYLKEKRNRRLQYRRILSKLKRLMPREIPIQSSKQKQPPKQEDSRKKGHKVGKKKKKHRKWKPTRPYIDNNERPVTVQLWHRNKIKKNRNRSKR